MNTHLKLPKAKLYDVEVIANDRLLQGLLSQIDLSSQIDFCKAFSSR